MPKYEVGQNVRSGKHITKILELKDGWARVIIEGKECWVMAALLEVIK
jgi:hypothetical protein